MRLITTGAWLVVVYFEIELLFLLKQTIIIILDIY